MKNLITTIIVLILIVISFIGGYISNSSEIKTVNPKEDIIIYREISIVKEYEECKKQGGEFLAYEHDNFNAATSTPLIITCEAPKRKIFEFEYKTPVQ